VVKELFDAAYSRREILHGAKLFVYPLYKCIVGAYF
jgi:hypothetical protein